MLVYLSKHAMGTTIQIVHCDNFITCSKGSHQAISSSKSCEAKQRRFSILANASSKVVLVGLADLL
jgi:hypothetical protein